MKRFPSLRDFLLMKDPTHSYKMSAHRDYRHAENFVELYDIAKASWEKFGDDGPPIGSKVETLTAGHGGGEGLIRTFEGICQYDKRFFNLSRVEGDRKILSSVMRTYWWIEIKAV